MAGAASRNASLAGRTDALSELLERVSNEVAICRRTVRQARDQLIAAEIAANRATREARGPNADGPY